MSFWSFLLLLLKIPLVRLKVKCLAYFSLNFILIKKEQKLKKYYFLKIFRIILKKFHKILSLFCNSKNIVSEIRDVMWSTFFILFPTLNHHPFFTRLLNVEEKKVEIYLNISWMITRKEKSSCLLTWFLLFHVCTTYIWMLLKIYIANSTFCNTERAHGILS